MKARYGISHAGSGWMTGTLLLVCLSWHAGAEEWDYPPPPGSYRGDTAMPPELPSPAGTVMQPAETADVRPAFDPGPGSSMLPLPESFQSAGDDRYGAANLFGRGKPAGPGAGPAVRSEDSEPPTFVPTTEYPGWSTRSDDAATDSQSATAVADRYPVNSFRRQVPQADNVSAYPQQTGVYPSYRDRAYIPPGPGYRAHFPPAAPYGYPQAGWETTPPQPNQPLPAAEKTPGIGSHEIVPTETSVNLFRPAD